MQEREKRIFGMLAGCALGDAMGMPSEGMDAKTIRTTFGTIRRFLPSCEKDVLGRSFKAGQAQMIRSTRCLSAMLSLLVREALIRSFIFRFCRHGSAKTGNRANI